MTNFFLRYFPPPKYLQMPAVGLDISDRSLKFAELLQTEGELVLGRFGSVAIPEGLIQSGEIKNAPALQETLVNTFKKSGIKTIVTSLPEEKAYVGQVTLPAMAREEIAGALEVSLEEYIPLPASQAVFDFELLPASEGLDHLDLVVVAFPRGLVQSYLEVIKAAGLEPLVFDMEAHALTRAVLPPGEEGSAMIIDFGRTRTSFVIVAGGRVRFTSTVRVAGEALDQALSKIFKIDIFEAERIKKERGLVRASENREVFSALLPIVSSIRDEVMRNITFWNTHTQHLHQASAEVKKLYLCGGDANLKGLTEYLAYELKLPVKLANPWINITDFKNYIPEITYQESLSYGTALGLALRGSQFK